MALHALGGILKHARALLALTNPTTNSYKRLVPGYEAPINLAYSTKSICSVSNPDVFNESKDQTD